MPHPKDMDEQADSRPDDAELMLMDLLYGELDQGDEAEARERVRERNLDTELGGLEELRAMLSELPDEEPPAAITAKLMHAAAMHAPGAAARKSAASTAGTDGEPGEGEKKGILAWLSSLIRPIAMYPGLAAATTLVLVVGVAGTLYLSGRDQLSEPRLYESGTATPGATMQAPEEAEAEARAEPMKAQDEAAEGGTWGQAEQAQEIALPQAGDGRGAGMLAGKRDREERAKQPAPQKSRASASAASKKRKASAYEGKELDQVLGGASSSSGAGAGTGTGYGKGAASAPRPATARAPATSSAKDSLSLDDESAAADMDAEDDGRYEEPARPAPRPAPEPTRDDSAGAPADKKAPESNADSARIRSLHDEARSAAANGQCDVVRKIESMIRKLDARYYRDTYRRDKALAACLGSKK